MKAAYILLIFIIVSFSLSAQSYVFYYINIDNAPNGSASGTMDAYIPSFQYPIQSTSLTFIENYLEGHGGKYKSSHLLLAGSPNTHVTIKCKAKKPWGPNYWLYGESQQVFTGGSLTQLPTMRIEDPPTPPVDPPMPK